MKLADFTPSSLAIFSAVVSEIVGKSILNRLPASAVSLELLLLELDVALFCASLITFCMLTESDTVAPADFLALSIETLAALLIINPESTKIKIAEKATIKSIVRPILALVKSHARLIKSIFSSFLSLLLIDSFL